METPNGTSTRNHTTPSDIFTTSIPPTNDFTHRQTSNSTRESTATNEPDTWLLLATYLGMSYPAIYCLVGVPFNVANIVIVRQQWRKSSHFVYVTILSFMDILLLIHRAAGVYLPYTQFPLTSAGCAWTQFTIQTSSQISSWTLVLLSCERAIVVKFPFSRLTYFSSKRALFSTSLVALVLILLNSILFLTVRVSEKYGSCEYRQQYLNLMRTVWYKLEAISYAFLPFLLLLLSNAVIIATLYKSLRVRDLVRLGQVIQTGYRSNRPLKRHPSSSPLAVSRSTHRYFRRRSTVISNPCSSNNNRHPSSPLPSKKRFDDGDIKYFNKQAKRSSLKYSCKKIDNTELSESVILPQEKFKTTPRFDANENTSREYSSTSKCSSPTTFGYYSRVGGCPKNITKSTSLRLPNRNRVTLSKLARAKDDASPGTYRLNKRSHSLSWRKSHRDERPKMAGTTQSACHGQKTGSLSKTSSMTDFTTRTGNDNSKSFSKSLTDLTGVAWLGLATLQPFEFASESNQLDVTEYIGSPSSSPHLVPRVGSPGKKLPTLNETPLNGESNLTSRRSGKSLDQSSNAGPVNAGDKDMGLKFYGIIRSTLLASLLFFVTTAPFCIMSIVTNFAGSRCSSDLFLLTSSFALCDVNHVANFFIYSMRASRLFSSVKIVMLKISKGWRKNHGCCVVQRGTSFLDKFKRASIASTGSSNTRQSGVTAMVDGANV